MIIKVILISLLIMNLLLACEKQDNKEITSENKKKQVNLPIKKINVSHIFGLLFAFYLLFYIFIIKLDPNSTKVALRFSYTEIPLILIVLLSMSLIYFSK